MGLNVATTSTTQLAYIPETTAGETPKTGKGVNLRLTGESFEQTVSKEVSKEMNPTRQTAGMFLTDSQVSGGFQFELSAKEYDPLLEALLMGTWSEFGVNGESPKESVQFAANKTITFTSQVAGLDSLTDGCYIAFGGTGLKPKNAKPLRVKSVSGKVVTVYDDLEAQTVADAVCRHSRLTNGTKARSFSFEKAFADISEHFVYRGCRISKASFNFESKSAISGSFEVLGMNSETGKSAMLGDKTKYVESHSYPIMDAVLGMDGILLNGVDIRESMTAGVQKLSLEFDNNMKAHDAATVLGAVDVTAGTINCTGSMTIYFNNSQVYNDVIKQKRFNLSFKVFDTDGRGYAFTLPSIELNSPKVNAGDNDSALMMELEFTALMHPELRQTIFIDRF